ncbi:hypothetical protein DAI22_07g220500 [Oryza sativa Japonica Group]|uniref:uncharacterized protein LOC127778590 n=1 Tax=Oryza glaberrima TaxID=4538 RepID=UPI0007753D8E|nr:uncharacterized protein LOC107281779 [Oryza sativa Japonica Group]XP_052161171.1 uncharacterized protein LOC127778590 [Oryza glaberrima]KAF2923797.1 hypothetical protein DAI22_07g220500 [Oryza sativa Japonica Group]
MGRCRCPPEYRMRIQWAVPVPDDSPMTLSFEAGAGIPMCPVALISQQCGQNQWRLVSAGGAAWLTYFLNGGSRDEHARSWEIGGHGWFLLVNLERSVCSHGVRTMRLSGLLTR